MNQFRQSLEDLFKEAEMDQKIKDVEEYYNKGVEDSRNNSIMNKLNELIGIRSAYADDNLLNQPLWKQSLESDILEDSNTDVYALNQNNPISKLMQISAAFEDMKRNYWDMKKDNTIGADDYFHCKANYEAADRGSYGERLARYLGDLKEEFDYYKNRWRGLSPEESLIDKIHDKKVNKIGRQRALSGLYSNSREACDSFRVKGINDKY